MPKYCDCPLCGNEMHENPSKPGYCRCETGTIRGKVKGLDYGTCWYGRVDVPKEKSDAINTVDTITVTITNDKIEK